MKQRRARRPPMNISRSSRILSPTSMCRVRQTGSDRGFVPAGAGETGPGPDFVPDHNFVWTDSDDDHSCDHSVDHAYDPYPAEEPHVDMMWEAPPP
eukprot:2494403-Heterocapsa_arctica.AAC.1